MKSSLLDVPKAFQHYSHVGYCAQTCEPPISNSLSPEFVCRRPLADTRDPKSSRTWEWDRRPFGVGESRRLLSNDAQMTKGLTVSVLRPEFEIGTDRQTPHRKTAPR